VEAGDLGDKLGAVAHALRVDEDVEKVGGEHAENARGVRRRLLDALLRIDLRINLLDVEYDEARAGRWVGGKVVGL